MNLKEINDSILVKNAEALVREERGVLTRFLHHLKEIERRRLFSSFGYKSLFEMAVKHFGYSEDEAYRRISAMKLLKEVPEVEEKINKGEITLTHLSLAGKHFRQEAKTLSKEVTKEHKLSLIEKISNTSVRKAQEITHSLSSNPEMPKPDRVRMISSDQVEMKLTVPRATEIKVGQLKGLLAHKYPHLSLGELFDLLCDLGLRVWDPGTKQASKMKKVVAPNKTCVENPKPKSKAQIRREVFFKARNKCENCGSQFALEIDHVWPKSWGGEDKLQNLRLLCRSCNQRAAINIFGVEKMDSYLNS